jgi:hypothetical protein
MKCRTCKKELQGEPVIVDNAPYCVDHAFDAYRQIDHRNNLAMRGIKPGVFKNNTRSKKWPDQKRPKKQVP